MGRASKARRRPRPSSQAEALRTEPNWPLLAISVLGIAVTGYLTWTSLSGGTVQGCPVGGGCDLVLTSRWAKLFGLPTALWGLLAYAGLAAIAFVRGVRAHWSYAWTATLFGACYSVYLTIVSLTVLGATCPYCLTSLGLMTAALGLVAWQRPTEMAQRSWVRLTAGRGALAIMVILLVHAGNTRPQAEPDGPEEPTIRALAEHLSDKGALFYGASWCSHCQEQKRLFGNSAKRLPYIECSPAGPNQPQAPSCDRAGVQSYPTWVIDGRAFPGEVLSLSRLASLTAFPGAENFR